VANEIATQNSVFRYSDSVAQVSFLRRRSACAGTRVYLFSLSFAHVLDEVCGLKAIVKGRLRTHAGCVLCCLIDLIDYLNDRLTILSVPEKKNTSHRSITVQSAPSLPVPPSSLPCPNQPTQSPSIHSVRLPAAEGPKISFVYRIHIRIFFSLDVFFRRRTYTPHSFVLGVCVCVCVSRRVRKAKKRPSITLKKRKATATTTTAAAAKKDTQQARPAHMLLK
jgi:hypothetical protein